MTSLHFTDILTIIVYFITVIGFGIWSSFQNRGSVDGFFIARRSINFIPVGASLFASCIGTSLFIGLSGSAANSGIAVAGFELNALFVLIILGWIFIPVYMRAGIYTMPEYIRKRFGGQRIRLVLSFLSLLLNVFIRITADLFGGALFIKMYLNIDLYLSIGILLLIAALFTIGGGASAVIWTDFIQTIVMVLGAFFLTIISFYKVGGFNGLVEKYSYAISSTTLYSNTTCGVPPSDYFDLNRAADRDFPWSGMTFGLTISAVWYWCSDQMIVQRALAAKNLTHVKAGCIFAGYLKLLPLFIIIMPGMIARILFNEEIGCTDPQICKSFCGSENGCSNIAYPKLIIDIMPVGFRGLMVAVMMAALMSSLTSVFNSCSVIFTMDIWKHFRKHAKDIELMIIGRIFVVIFVIVSILWIPIIEMNQGSRLFDYIQSVTSFLAPPVCSVYVQAILFQRINEPGAFWGLITGLCVGLLRFIWQFSYQEPSCLNSHLDNRPALISKVHFLHFGIFLFLITSLTSWAISLLTKPIPYKYIRRLTYFTIDDPQEPEPMPENEEFDNKVHHDFVHLFDHKPNEKTKKYKKIFFWICGIETFVNKENDIVEKKQHIDTSIEENKYWSNICDINAVIAMACCGFCYAFFNRY